jgi:hypothetical protein
MRYLLAAVCKVRSFPVQFDPQFLFSGQHKSVPARKDLFILMKHRVPNNRRVFQCAQDDPHCRIVVRTSLEMVNDEDIHIHLADVLMSQFTCLEIEEHKTLQYEVRSCKRPNQYGVNPTTLSPGAICEALL